ERVTVIDFSCRPTVAGFGNATPGGLALALVRKSTCPSGSAVHTNPGSALATRLISGVIFSRQCSRTRGCATPGGTVYCTLVLVCQSEARNSPQNRNATLQSRNPLVSLVTARTGHRFLRPHPSRRASEWRDYFRRP